MPQNPFPLPPGDAEEPGGSPLPPALEGDGEGLGQGLYVCLPPEQLTLAGFAQGGEADTMTPGPLLATIVGTVAGQDGGGLAGCSDDQLMGIISAARRMQARDEWTLLAAIAEFAARHDGSRPTDEFAADELAFELHLTQQSAAGQMDYASTVARRLPATFAALGAGRIHPVHVRIIEDETSILSDQDAAKADTVLAEAGPGLTFGELRAAAHKLVLKLDPEAVRKRKEAARQDAHVRRFREESGNAGMVARELPSDEVLASWQHVEQRALDLRAAGMPGTLQELRVRAYLDLLQERDSRDLPADPVPADGGEVGEADVPDQGPPDTGPPDPGAGPDGSGGPGGNSGPAGPGGPDGNGPGGRGPGPRPAPATMTGPSLAALVTITIPWDTWRGRSEIPGKADGFGPVDGDDARGLAAAAARHPRTPRPPPLPPSLSPPCTPTAPPPPTPACPAATPARVPGRPSPLHHRADPGRPRPPGAIVQAITTQVALLPGRYSRAEWASLAARDKRPGSG